MLRVTPGVEAHTHEYVETGNEDSKFGFGPPTATPLEAARRVAVSPRSELVGLHCHIGSQIFLLQSFRGGGGGGRLAAAVVAPPAPAPSRSSTSAAGWASPTSTARSRRR